MKLNFDQAGLIKLNRKVREVLRKGSKGLHRGKRNPQNPHYLYLLQLLSEKLKEAKSFPLAPMGAAPCKADSGKTAQKIPKSGAPKNKK